MGTIFLWLLTACSISRRQLAEATESGLMTKRKLSAESMLRKISCCHSAVRGMSFQSIQALRLRAVRASPSLRTKSLSFREYEMNTFAIQELVGAYRTWRSSL